MDYLSRSLRIAVACLSATIIAVSSAGSESFQKLYDHYFPRNDRYQNGEYRLWFDATLSGPDPKSDKDTHNFYRAFHGHPGAFRVFAHHPDRTGEGEFTLTWIKECLVLLLKLGDGNFARLLASEDKTTREIVGKAIEQQVDWTKHDFPKTRSLYSYRYISPSHQAVEQKHGRKLRLLIAALAMDRRFADVRVYNRDGVTPPIRLVAPKSLPSKDKSDLQRLIHLYLGQDASLVLR